MTSTVTAANYERKGTSKDAGAVIGGSVPVIGFDAVKPVENPSMVRL
jgi:hypothetical protein